MDTPKIYVACLAAYNNGHLSGKWINAAQDVDEIYADIQQMLAESPIENAEEWSIHDYEGFGEASLSESEDIETVAKIAAFIVERGDLGGALLCDYTIEEAETLLDDHYHGTYDDEVDFAYSLFEDCYPNAIPENLLYYFDYKAFARDLFMSDYFSVEANNKTHVFSNY